MVAVIDTHALQAFHRSGVLRQVRDLFGAIAITPGVERETRSAYLSLGPSLVPDLGASPWISVEPVSEQDVAAARGPVPRREAREEARRRALGRPPRHFCRGLVIGRAELEVVLAAELLSGTAVLDDADGIRCARARGVQTTTDWDVLLDLKTKGLVPAVKPLVEALARTGYGDQATHADTIRRAGESSTFPNGARRSTIFRNVRRPGRP